LLREQLKRHLPPEMAAFLRGTRDKLRIKAQSAASDPRQFDRPSTRRECPICSYAGRFWSFGTPPRAEAMCPNCMSLERHRLLQLLFDRRIGDLTTERRILHFAPEGFIRARLAPTGRYITTDFSGYDVDCACAMETIPFPEACFSVVIANHVLEHVTDEDRALREIHRVTEADGLAVLSVPQVHGWEETYEDSGITDPGERRRHFGQEDHLRLYGRDVEVRLRRSGFAVEPFRAEQKDEIRFGLTRGETLYVARPLRRVA
jgi:SAM-dependent methyltransferase